MSIDVSCPGCGRKGRVPDSAAGKRAKCPACGTGMLVPGTNAIPVAMLDDDPPRAVVAPPPSPPPRVKVAPPPPAPPKVVPPPPALPKEEAPGGWDEFLKFEETVGGEAGRRREEEVDGFTFLDDESDAKVPAVRKDVAGKGRDFAAADSRYEPPPLEENPLREYLYPIIIGGCLVLLLVTLVKAFHHQPDSPSFAGSAAFNEPGGIEATKDAPAPVVAGANPDARAANQPAAITEEVIKERAKAGSRPMPGEGVPAASGAPAVAGPPDASAGKAKEEAGDWNLRADPFPQPIEFAKGNTIRLPIPAEIGAQDVLFPSTLNPVVAIGRNAMDRDVREVWDLRVNKRIGRLVGRLEIGDRCALSPDGKLFAGFATFKNRVWAWTTYDGHGQVEIPCEHEPEFLDFTGKDGLVTVDNWDRRGTVHSLKDGSRILDFTLPDRASRDGFALSPGRRYLAMSGPGYLQVVDLEDGAIAAKLALKKSGNFEAECRGLAFSRDGKELAGVFTEAFQSPTIRAWTVEGGREAAMLAIPERLLGQRALGDRGPAIQFLPDGDGFLVYGQGIFDRRTGERIGELPFEHGRYPQAPRVILDPGRVLTVVGERPGLLSVVRYASWNNQRK